MKQYETAVIDGNQPPDMITIPESFHHSREAANREVKRRNRRNPNAHFYAIDWNAPASARLRPAPEHYPAKWSA